MRLKLKCKAGNEIKNMNKYHCDCECKKCYGKYHTMHVKKGDLDTIIIKCVSCGFEIEIPRMHFGASK